MFMKHVILSSAGSMVKVMAPHQYSFVWFLVSYCHPQEGHLLVIDLVLWNSYHTAGGHVEPFEWIMCELCEYRGRRTKTVFITVFVVFFTNLI